MTGPEIRVARHALGWSQRRLAEALGVAPNTVARWERGEIQPPPYLRLALGQIESQHHTG